MKRRFSTLTAAATCLALVGTTAFARPGGGHGGGGGGWGGGRPGGGSPGFSGARPGGPGPGFAGPRPSPAFHGGYHGGYRAPYYRPGWSGPRVGLGIGLGVGLGAGAAYGYYGGWRPRVGVYVPVLPPVYSTWYYNGAPYYYADGAYYAPGVDGGYSVVEPPPADALVPGSPGAPVPQGPPDPVVYPRNGQSAQQTEADRQDCNRWATTQPSAVADATVFQRAVAACMDARGYTVR